MTATDARAPVVLDPGAGRRYDMGPIQAVFKADGSETAGGYSISEWWLEPHTTGPGAHSHPEDDVFYVLEGTMSLLVDGRWIDAPAGSFVLVPGGSIHDFENRSDARGRGAQRLGTRRLRTAHARHRRLVRRAPARHAGA